MRSLLIKLEQAAELVSCICLVGMTLIVTLAANSRYFFNAPTELTNTIVAYYLMVAVSYLPLASALRHDEHVKLDVAEFLFTPKLHAALEFAAAVLVAAVFVVVAVAGIINTYDVLRKGLFLPAVIAWPMWLSVIFIPVGFSILVVAELGLVTPPFGLNVFMVSKYSSISSIEVFHGATPHIIMHIIAIGLLLAFPQIILWLPNNM